MRRRAVLFAACVTALFLSRPVAGQAGFTGYVGGGFVAQRQLGTSRETAFGYTAVLGVSRSLRSVLRLHLETRYSFDLALGSGFIPACSFPCTTGFSATKVLSTTAGFDIVTSQRRPGFIFRAGGGLDLIAYPSPGSAGLLPALSTAAGVRIPFGPRGALVVEGRYDRIFGVQTGPALLLPLVVGFEL